MLEPTVLHELANSSHGIEFGATIWVTSSNSCLDLAKMRLALIS